MKNTIKSLLTIIIISAALPCIFSGLAMIFMIFLAGIVQHFGLLLWALVFLAMLRALRRTLVITSTGIMIVYDNGLLLGKLLPWSAMTKIALTDNHLVFHTDDQHAAACISLNSLMNDAHIESIYNSISVYAGDVPHNFILSDLINVSQDATYTQLWLDGLHDLQTQPDLKPLTIVRNKYKIIRKIGAGGQGAVHEVEDSENRHFALKEYVLPTVVSVCARSNAIAQVEREARIISSLVHPQIVTLEDTFIENERAFLLLNLVDGSTLSDLVNQKQSLPVEQCLDLLKQMCQILHYLHTRDVPILHRDFTADNLILDERGKLTLIDFNVASDDSGSKTVVGKAAYIAPEQFRGKAEPASDIYSMGGTLFYLITGKDPEPISISSPLELVDVPVAFDTMVRQMTNLNPAQRPSAERILELIAEQFPELDQSYAMTNLTGSGEM